MRTCPKCQQAYPDDTDFCSRDGTPLPVISDVIDPALGASLARRYRIVRRLGGGGMGAVYLAQQIAVGNRPVALKILLRKLLDDPEFLFRFHNEAASTGRIHHPNVVTIYESDQAEEGTPYIAMEYLEGRTLRQVLKSRGTLSITECLEITQQAARGLNAAHKLNIIHRDLKPDNIFLTLGDEGELLVKIVDFGIAKLIDRATCTLTGVMLGTPAYMSAEQAAGMNSDELDARSDIYSLGIVVFEMLTGRTPFESDTPLGFVRKHMTEEPPALRAVKTDLRISEQFEKVMGKVLTKDRSQRYSSTLEFARDLVAAQGAESISQTGGAKSPLAASEVYGAVSVSASAGGVAGTGVETPPPMLIDGRPEATENLTPTVSPGPPTGAHTFAKETAPKPRRPATPPGARLRLVKRALALTARSALAVTGLLALLAVPASYWYRSRAARVGMVYIPGGTFIMGRDHADDPAERPAHSVTVAPFYLDRTPVTNAEYAEFVRATGHAAPPSWNNGSYPAAQARWPVTDVTWHDAQAFAKWRHKRLPTEAEWEFAARGSDGRLYPWGNNFNPDLTNSAESKLGHPQPIGSHPDGASPFGIFDMAGTVWQWCQDAFQPYPNQKPAFEIPITAKVIRGGSYASDKAHVTTTTRNMDLATSHSARIGFRCAKSP